MSPCFSHARRALAPITLGAALLALPGLAGAGAVTSATAVAQIDLVDAGPDVTVTYEFFTAETISSTSASGNAVFSALQTPDTDIDELLFFEAQDAQSQAEAYTTDGWGLGSADAEISNEGAVVMTNSGSSDDFVTLGWEYFLEVVQTVTGYHDFASAYAYAEVVMFDELFDFYLNESIQALYDSDPSSTAADLGAITLRVPAQDSNTLTIQLITEADAQFVPAPATPALLALGLVGLRARRRGA